LSQLFDAYKLADSIGSVADTLKLKKELEDKLEQTKNEIEQRIAHNNRMKMEAAYADAEYIANQVDLVYSEYALQMSEQNMTDVYDPEGTIAMNTRFRPSPKYTFGFEDIFNENIKAGSDMYVYNVLWKT
jgi:ATP-dependent protease HslVU (ClpYQ) peptidase subunit